MPVILNGLFIVFINYISCDFDSTKHFYSCLSFSTWLVIKPACVNAALVLSDYTASEEAEKQFTVNNSSICDRVLLFCLITKTF